MELPTEETSDTDRHIQNRQQRVREWHACETVNTSPGAPVATIWLSVVPNGTIRTTAINVEVEQVAPLLAAMDALRIELERFVSKSRKVAKIIPFKLG